MIKISKELKKVNKAITKGVLYINSSEGLYTNLIQYKRMLLFYKKQGHSKLYLNSLFRRQR